MEYLSKLTCEYMGCKNELYCFDYCEEHFTLVIGDISCKYITDGKKCGDNIYNMNYCTLHYKNYLGKCKHILKSGSKKGEKCQFKEYSEGYCKVHFSSLFLCKKCDKRKVINNYCLDHFGGIVFPNNKECKFIMKGGVRRGKRCDRKIFKNGYCRFHLD